MRVRAFTQDDAHIFCTEDQLAAECLKINDLILSTYADFGFEDIVVKLSTRPDKRVGTDEMWDHAEAVMTKVLDEIAAQSGGRIKTGINPGEGAFYGPKFEYVLRDAIGRDWQCGTTQVDFNLPERFGAFYIDHDGDEEDAGRWSTARSAAPWNASPASSSSTMPATSRSGSRRCRPSSRRSRRTPTPMPAR